MYYSPLGRELTLRDIQFHASLFSSMSVYYQELGPSIFHVTSFENDDIEYSPCILAQNWRRKISPPPLYDYYNLSYISAQRYSTFYWTLKNWYYWPHFYLCYLLWLLTWSSSLRSFFSPYNIISYAILTNTASSLWRNWKGK